MSVLSRSTLLPLARFMLKKMKQRDRGDIKHSHTSRSEKDETFEFDSLVTISAGEVNDRT